MEKVMAKFTEIGPFKNKNKDPFLLKGNVEVATLIPCFFVNMARQ